MTFVELVSKRTANSKTRIDKNKYIWDGSIGAIHYLNGVDWLEIDNEFTPALAPWDWQMLNAGYHIKVMEDFTAGQIIEFSAGGETVQFQPMALEWTNDIDQIQPIAMPYDVPCSVTNPIVDLLSNVGMPSHQGTITWMGGYGAGIDFRWICGAAQLLKRLSINSFNNLPVPKQYILDGGNPVLRLNLIFAPSPSIDIYVDGQPWNKKSKVQTFNAIEFRKGGDVLWVFDPLRYWGSDVNQDDNDGQAIATLEKRGNSLYISIRVPYIWLQSATYPVEIDTDVDLSIVASLDDTFVVNTTSNWPLSSDYFVGNYQGTTLKHGGVRFIGTNINLGATVSVAYVSLYVKSTSADDPLCDIYCQSGTSTPENFADGETLVPNRARTSASAEWDATGLGTGYKNSPNFASAVEELAGGYAITDLNVLFIGKGSSTQQMGAYQYNYGPGTYPPMLHVEWSTGGATYYHGLKIEPVGELALCDVGTNPLRIRKGDTTYGIELVATDDPNASNLRIYHGGVKSIRKYT